MIGRLLRFPTARAFAVVLAAAVLLAITASTASAQDDDVSSSARELHVTAVDATGADVEVAVLGAETDVSESSLTILEGTTPVELGSLTTSQAASRPTELVFIIDTNARSAQGAILERIKAQLISDVAQLSPETSVAVISAGTSAIVETKMTSDRERLVESIDGLALKNGSAIYNAIDRAGTLFTDDAGVVRSVIVFSSGPDTSSDTTLDLARVGIVQRGAQLVSVVYDGGDIELLATVSRTAGVELTVGDQSELEAVMSEATMVAADRLLVSFQGTTAAAARSNVTLTIGESVTEFSYPAGVLAEGPLQLAPQPVTGDEGFALFRTSIGLYLALGLAFIGISLGVWSLGSILAGGDLTLDGMLSRYTDGSLDADDANVEELIVQSALLQRAVTFSESFAEKRGFLARVEELLERANLPIRAGEAMFILAAVTTLSAGLALVLTKSVIAAVLFGVAGTGMVFFVVRLLGRRRFKAFESQLPDALQLLSGTLRAGYSLPQGLDVVSREIADPMGHELRRAMTEAQLGRDLEECLGGVAERLKSADFAWTVMAINIQREVGGNLNELLMSVSDTMIARERLKREINALTAEGRVSAAVLSGLPPGLGLVMWVMNPEYINLLFSEFLGNILLGMGLVSALIGLAWMKKVIVVDV